MEEGGQNQNLGQGQTVGVGPVAPVLPVPPVAPTPPILQPQQVPQSQSPGGVPGVMPAAGGQPVGVSAEEAAKAIVAGDGEKGGGWWMWLVVALLVLICGGIGYWLVRMDVVSVLTGKGGSVAGPTVAVPTGEEQVEEKDSQTEQLERQGSSDEIGAIENDLTFFDYSDLTGGMEKIEEGLAE